MVHYGIEWPKTLQHETNTECWFWISIKAHAVDAFLGKQRHGVVLTHPVFSECLQTLAVFMIFKKPQTIKGSGLSVLNPYSTNNF